MKGSKIRTLKKKIIMENGEHVANVCKCVGIALPEKKNEKRLKNWKREESDHELKK
jgi:hypothetical protein